MSAIRDIMMDDFDMFKEYAEEELTFCGHAIRDCSAEELRAIVGFLSHRAHQNRFAGGDIAGAGYAAASSIVREVR